MAWKKCSFVPSALMARGAVMRWAVLVFSSWFCPTFLSPPPRGCWLFLQPKLFPGCYRASGKLDLYSNEYWPESKIMGTLKKKRLFSPPCLPAADCAMRETNHRLIPKLSRWKRPGGYFAYCHNSLELLPAIYLSTIFRLICHNFPLETHSISW